MMIVIVSPVALVLVVLVSPASSMLTLISVASRILLPIRVWRRSWRIGVHVWRRRLGVGCVGRGRIHAWWRRWSGGPSIARWVCRRRRRRHRGSVVYMTRRALVIRCRGCSIAWGVVFRWRRALVIRLWSLGVWRRPVRWRPVRSRRPIC